MMKQFGLFAGLGTSTSSPLFLKVLLTFSRYGTSHVVLYQTKDDTVVIEPKILNIVPKSCSTKEDVGPQDAR